MSYWIDFDDMNRVVDADATPQPTYAAPTPAQKPTTSDRLRRAKAWFGLAVGVFLAFGALALWAVIALAAGFVAWLISMAVIGLMIVAMLWTVTFQLIRPRR